jgi:hypothetical protein
LKRYLGKYCFEPQTAEAFQQREAIREQLKDLESRCGRLSRLLNQGNMVLESIEKDLKDLHAEFYWLENQIWRYLDQC